MPRTRRVVLVGGGPAHVAVLREAARAPFGDLTLVSPHSAHYYAGMLTAQLRGTAADRALSIDLPALCVEAGARFVLGTATRIDATRDSVVVHTAGEPLTGDACSLEIGSIAAGSDIPGVDAFAFAVQPQGRWRSLLDIVREVMRSGASVPFSLTVVGGGACGVESMLALVARARAAGQTVNPTLVTASDALTEDLGPRVGARALAILKSRGVRVVTGRAVTQVTPDRVLLDDGSTIQSGLTVWATGHAAPAMIRASGLPVDADGYLRVHATLRAVDGVAVYGAGDCITHVEAPWARRFGAFEGEARVLASNLRAAMRTPQGEPVLFTATEHPLAILDTSDDKALLYWRGWSTYSRWARTIKRRIDAGWMERYRVR